MSTEQETIDPHAIEARWLPVWDDLDLNTVVDAEIPEGAKTRYVLDMFPYPSGDLHMGHAEAFSIGDVVARYWRRRGETVLHPIGWDAFGLPAENAAIARGLNPADWTYANIETQAESFRRFAISFDWTRRLATCDPGYYRWTQWLFQRFLAKGLAYRKESPVNWCPKDQTVLANEQVINGHCERCGTEVTKRSLTQWYMKITEYADRLLDDAEALSGHWPDRVLTMQKNWIGRSVGAEVSFEVENRDEKVTVYTTRPDTLYGATFFVVAADSELAVALCSPEQREALAAYRSEVNKLSEIERQVTDREKTGVSLGIFAVNPINGERIPIWAADYVLADYGTGAIMAVPAHDQRDLDFARQFDLPVRVVVSVAGAQDPVSSGIAAVGEGKLINSGEYDGMGKSEAITAIVADLEQRGVGKGAVNFRLRDWLFSRQRYWGAPIPVVYCANKCDGAEGIVAVPDDQLPVELPHLVGDALLPKGQSPLAAARDWVETTCPLCGGPAERDTDTMDTFVDSSWYAFRYTAPNDTTRPFDREAVDRWMPVAQYVGGVEHAILHLLYTRFVTKVLYDLDLIGFAEPFAGLLNQGQVINGGKAMSKSLGNGVNLQDQLAIHGVDTLRMAILFAGPPEDDIDWADMTPSGMAKQLARMLRVAADAGLASGEGDGTALARVAAATVDEVTRLTEAFRFNVAIARLMTLTNELRKAIDGGVSGSAVRDAADVLARLLSCYAPFTSEECWSRLGHDVAGGDSVHKTTWPAFDPALLVSDTTTCVVQVAGKVRDRLEVASDIGEDELRSMALATDGVIRALDGRGVKTVIVRAPKLVNVVPA